MKLYILTVDRLVLTGELPSPEDLESSGGVQGVQHFIGDLLYLHKEDFFTSPWTWRVIDTKHPEGGW